MRVVCQNHEFGFEHLVLEDRPEPAFEAKQVLIRVRAVSLNYRDLMMSRGEYNPRQKLPLVLCSDAAGEVVACGSDVSEWTVGDRVCPIFAPRWQRGPLTREAQQSALGGPLDGTLSEYIVSDADALVAAPAHLSMTEAACLPCSGVTAYRALVEFGQLRAGDFLVCIGTGGVSLSALSTARALGIRVILVGRNRDKLERARALGAEHAIDSNETPAWSKDVRALTGGQGAEHVLEVGGANTIEQSLRALRMGGSLSVIGVLSGAQAAVDLRPILMQDLRIQGVFVGSRAAFLKYFELVREHALRPQLDRVFPLAEARAAFEYAHTGRQFGKVVITLD